MYDFINLNMASTIYHWIRPENLFKKKSVNHSGQFSTIFYNKINFFFVFFIFLCTAKLKLIRSPEFADDLELHRYAALKKHGLECGFKLPALMENIGAMSNDRNLFSCMPNENLVFNCAWLDDEDLGK